MREENDFSKGRKNPYTKRLKAVDAVIEKKAALAFKQRTLFEIPDSSKSQIVTLNESGNKRGSN